MNTSGTNTIAASHNLKETDRNVGLDVLKFIAAFMITNCHLGVMYGKYSILATGGWVGDALFFFCSGFALFLRPVGGVISSIGTNGVSIEFIRQ